MKSIAISVSMLCLLSAACASAEAFGKKKIEQPEAQNTAKPEAAKTAKVIPAAKDWKTYLETARRSYKEGNMRDAMSNLDLALAGAERLRDGARAVAFCSIADEYIDYGNYPKAASLLEDAVKMKRKIPLFKGANTAKSLDHLAQAYARTGKIEDADKLSKEALETFAGDREKQPGDYAISLANRAYIMRMQKKYDEAEKLLTEAVAVQEKAGTDKIELAKTLINLGGVFCDDGKLEEAAKPIEKAQVIIQEKLPSNHVLYKLSLKSQRVLCKRRVDALLREDTNIYRPEVAKSLTDLGAMYMSEGDIAQALETYRQAMNIYEKVSPQDVSKLTTAIDKCVECLTRIGDKKEAAMLTEKARALRPQ